MRWPFMEKAAEKLEPEPEPGPAERERTLVSELRTIDGALAALDHEMLAFKKRHTLRVDQLGRILSIQTESVNAFASIDRDWRILLKRRDSFFPRRNSILRELAALKVPVHA